MYYTFLKWPRAFPLCTKKETNCVLCIRLYIAVTTDLNPCSRSVLITFTTSCQYKLSKQLVQRIIEAHIESK